MSKKNKYHMDATDFSKVLQQADLRGKLKIGKFILLGKKGVSEKIQYNQAGIDLLNNLHEYTFPINDGKLQVSLQLYENIRKYYRLFCYTKINKKQGMTFSVNLTTAKESNEIIFLTQKIKFIEQYEGSSTLAQAHRRQKQIVFCDLLKRLGFDISDHGDLVLGIFDPSKKELVNTSRDKFLNDFITVSILKGHFQGNKGYQLEILPTFNKLDYIFTGKDEEAIKLPLRLIKRKATRAIPLGMRYRVLKQSGFKCVACGRSAKDGVKLHIDHKTPFSLGGLTELKNLQTLCEECNISKSNKFLE